MRETKKIEFLQSREKKGWGVKEEMVRTYSIAKMVIWAKVEGLFTKFLNAGTRRCLLKLNFFSPGFIGSSQCHLLSGEHGLLPCLLFLVLPIL